jgi:hypothetical protein
MNLLKILRILSLGVLMVTLGLSTQSAFANGPHGAGGGGFHGGGGGFHGGGYGYHGGYGGYGYRGGYGGYGYHGGYGGYGYRGGYGGWRGGYWGYPGWGWGGWGFGLSFNFGWPWGYGYPYAYGYYPYYGYSPYYYPYPYGPVSGPSGYSDPTAYSQTSGNYPNDAPVAQPRYSVPQSAPNSNSLTLHEATYVPRPPSYRSASATGSAANYHPASAAGQLPAMRPEVQNVIRALRGMPPAARQRAIDSGQYSGFSPQELKLVTYAANLP